MKGASKYDPVTKLNLEGQPVRSIRCPHMISVPKKKLWGRRVTNEPRPCGEQALLVRFPAPFGLRSYCEEGHVEVLSELSCPGLWAPMKSHTD